MLINKDNIAIEEPAEALKSQAFSESETANDFEVFTHLQSLQQVVGVITPEARNIHFACMVEWSMHDLLEYVLQKTGPAKVYVATWTISEAGARALTNLLANGSITELQGLFDFRSSNRHPDAFHLAVQQCAKVRLHPIHAKVTIIINDNWSICIAGSANYTNKKRIECGVISINNGVAQQHLDKWLLAMIEKGEVFN